MPPVELTRYAAELVERLLRAMLLSTPGATVAAPVHNATASLVAVTVPTSMAASANDMITRIAALLSYHNIPSTVSVQLAITVDIVNSNISR